MPRVLLTGCVVGVFVIFLGLWRDQQRTIADFNAESESLAKRLRGHRDDHGERCEPKNGADRGRWSRHIR